MNLARIRMKTFSPDGTNLGVTRLTRLARDSESVFSLPSGGIEDVALSRMFVEDAIKQRLPVYGLTTGLGARVTEILDQDQLTDFSYQTLRGRAHTLGEPLPAKIVRGAMIARVNTMMTGASGVSSAVPEFIVRCLNKNVTPVVGRIGSIGASDLCMGATMGLAFIGEGMMKIPGGEVVPSMQALNSEGLDPLALGPRDGLALANHSCFSASIAAFAVDESNHFFNCLQSSSAMTMEAMSANFSPISESVMSVSQHQSHGRTAAHLREILIGSTLNNSGVAKKIQDPLSIRNIVQVHGSLLTALSMARLGVNAELNSVSDNPVVDLKNRRMVSSGGYFSSELTLCVESVARALDMAVTTLLARLSKLMSERYSGLPMFLASPGANSNGFAPVMKIAESLVSKIKSALVPVSVWPSVNADGVEDVLSNSFERSQSVLEALNYGRQLVSIEMIIAAQALELSGRLPESSASVQKFYHYVRSRVESLEDDRPMAMDIENLAISLRRFEFPLLDHGDSRS